MPSSPYELLRGADAPAARMLISVKVEDHAAESQGHDGFWT